MYGASAGAQPQRAKIGKLGAVRGKRRRSAASACGMQQLDTKNYAINDADQKKKNVNQIRILIRRILNDREI